MWAVGAPMAVMHVMIMLYTIKPQTVNENDYDNLGDEVDEKNMVMMILAMMIEIVGDDF